MLGKTAFLFLFCIGRKCNSKIWLKNEIKQNLYQHQFISREKVKEWKFPLRSFKYYDNALGGGMSLSQNADTAVYPRQGGYIWYSPWYPLTWLTKIAITSSIFEIQGSSSGFSLLFKCLRKHRLYNPYTFFHFFGTPLCGERGVNIWI